VGVGFRALWDRGRARHPELAVELAAFEAYLGGRVPENPGDVERLPAEDLYLACACLAGTAGAMERFTDEHRAALAMFVAPVVRVPHAIDELVDALLTEILMGSAGGAPRLATYAGRGPLRTWLRMIAVRRSLNESRDGERHARLEHRLFAEATNATNDPEVTFIKERYGADFQAAFRDAIAAMPAADRALLRLHYGQELGLGELAAMHGWSKATASRRVAAARELLLDAACALLRHRLGVDRAELESLFRVVRSQLEVSLGGLLRTGAR
jgi:RNA polymerase sigma-70 factor, ECF subfamily